MKISKTKKLTHADEMAVWKLWNEVYPVNIQHESIADLKNYLNGLIDLENYLVRDSSKKIVAWAFRFTRDEEDWFAILIDNAYQKQGLGSRLIDEIKKETTLLYGWVIDTNQYKKQNGENYLSPMAFYLKNKFVICETIRLETDKISAVKIEWINTN